MKSKKARSIKLSSRPVAIVTGGASPLGSAICRKLASRDMNIAIHYGRSIARSKTLQQELEAQGIKTLLCMADLGNPDQTSKLVKVVTDHWGRVDLVVNSASIFEPTPFEKTNWKEWQHFLNVNTLSPAALVLAARPWLEKTRGSVVNVTDIYGEMPILKDHAAYSTSKAALIFLTRYLAQALGPQVRVNAVSPGVITFPGHYDSAKQKALVQKSALKRQGKPEDIAEAVWFLASNTFVTGHVLKVDGGRFIS